MGTYQRAVDNRAGKKEYNPSDRKKLLGLPFLATKRSELPDPKKGQKEWDIFYAMFGEEWDSFTGMLLDKEDKVTEFNYEHHIPKHILNTLDTQSEDFKQVLKEMNFNTKTRFEQHKENKEAFK